MADVECVSSSVVREYLSRKGLKDTLTMLDKEMPRSDNCISNRAQLAKELHINTLMKKNKESQSSFRTMLEVIVQFMMNKTWQQKHSVTSLTEPEKTSREVHSPEKVESYEKINRNADHDRNETENDPRKIKSEKTETKQKVIIPLKDDLKSHLENERRIQLENSASSDDKSISRDNYQSLTGRDKINEGSDMDLSVHHGSSKLFSRNKVKSVSHLQVSFDEMDLVKPSSVHKQAKPETTITKELSERTFQDKHIFGNNENTKKGTSSNDAPSMKSSSLKKSSRRQRSNVSGGFMSTGNRKNERTRYIKESFREKPKYFAEDVKEIKDDQSWRNPGTFSADKNLSINEEPFFGKDEKTRNVKEDFREKPKYFVEDLQENQGFLVRRSRETLHSDDKLTEIQEPNSVHKREKNTVLSDWKKEIMQKKESRKNPPSLQLKTKNVTSRDELIFEDIDDSFDDELDKLPLSTSPGKSSKSLLQSHPITLKQAKDLKTLVFGSAVGCFNSEWRNQGFSFCHLDHLSYGIIQHKGGPCGLLASVQAVVLKQLLFKDRLSTSSGITKQHFHFSSQETSDALCAALVEILWRAGSFKTARVALRCEKDQFIPSGGYKADRLTEKLAIYETNDCSQLEIFMKENIGQFSDNGGCILFLYSVILTRTVATIKEDMDDENETLMGAHGYCTQDMVNLLVTGKAISNTFDGIIELDSGGDTKNILKGIEKQSDIGLLSLFEHYKSCLVGSNLKCPKYPIWVVCSESHFSVLFSMKRSLVNERRSQKVFDLYYYDGLAGQTEEIRLTVGISGESVVQDTPDDLTPPLEHCIRTKWKDAVVDWNGTEPLL